MIRTVLEAHAAACREAAESGRERPRWAGGSLFGANLTGADLTGANLAGANLVRANLARAKLSGADLTRANFFGANLSDTHLTGATLAEATLAYADLTGADLAGTTLTGADLRWTTLVRADLTGARLSEGVARGRAIGGHVGGHHWWAVGLEDGGAVLQFGCEHHILEWWLAQGPELAVHHGHPPEFWAEGPAVAIAAAVELSQALPAGVRR